MSQPIIGLPLYRDYYGNPLWSAPIRYVEAIQSAGGECLPLAPFSSDATLAAQWALLDGLLLSGGGDVSPERYGVPHTGLSKIIDPERDAMEARLVEWAFRDELPILGICRGIQSLNAFRGGTLVQDIPTMRDTTIVHSMDRSLPRSHIQHQVRCQPGSLLAEVLGQTDAIEVNSMHHQCIDQVASGFDVVAWATDGTPEGIELTGGERFVVGVQWHPEEMVPGDAVMRRLFHRFVAACNGRNS